MTKLLVETTGEFQLVDFYEGGTVLHHDRPTVVVSTIFVQTQTANGRLQVLGELTDEATDEAFVEALKGSKDATVAVEAFKAEFGVKALPKPAPAPEPKGRTK